jgi:FtsP/CotA-like multicopper oxidase with cupredoxin domain
LTRRELLSALGAAWASQSAPPSQPDVTLHIAEVALDLGPKHSVRTLAFNGQVPGPLLRVPEGKSITVEVANDFKETDIVHWHGFHIPSDVDGSTEEGTPPVPARSRRSYTFAARPAGTRWYHSHTMAGHNLNKATYTGLFGLFVVEPRENPGGYDQDVPVLLHEWLPYMSAEAAGDVAYRLYSINGKMLGAGEPVRVRRGQRVLFRIVNASATMAHRLALPGHLFQVTALDGNAVPSPRPMPVVELGPAERVDAVVEMNNPGVWILGEVRDDQRIAGMGMTIEYEGAAGPPRWSQPPSVAWDYTAFGSRPGAQPEPDARVPLVFKAVPQSHRWTINGKSYPRTVPIRVTEGRRYRLIFDNQSADPHPVHLHRHTFELVKFDGRATAGILKDVVMVPAWRQVEADLVAANPGPTLFHCHQQFHMDMGFMAMLEYTG